MDGRLQQHRAALGALYTDGARLMMHGSTTVAGRRLDRDLWFERSEPVP